MESLKTFLKKNRFKYHVVPSASRITESYGVSGFPTHIVVNREGEMVYRSSGGSRDIHESLKPVIEATVR